MKSFKQFNEVAPPGFGHTKSDKEKGVKKGGTAAAFKRALDRGDFKGLPGSKTKKEKTADMFKLMWAMKNKGDKPHYKPGTDKKYEKYQEEETSMPKKVEKSKGRHPRDQKELERAQEYIKKHPKFGVGEDWKPEIEHVKGSDLRKKAAEKKRKEAEKSLPPHLKLDVMRKAFASEAVKGQDTESRKEGAKERATEKRAHDAWKKRPGTKKRPLYTTTKHTKSVGDNYATQQKQSIDWHDKKTKGKFIPGTTSESLGFTIDSGEHKKASKKAKMRNLAKGNTNPNEKAAAEKKAGGPKLIGEKIDCDCDCGQDPCIKCGESHHDIKESISTSDVKKLQKASVLSFSNDPKSVDRARARQVEVDYKDLMKQQAAKKRKKIKEEKESCPAGQYYCFDRGKCMPIPEGNKVRKDGELVKENLLKKLVDREVRIMRGNRKPPSEEEVKKIKDERREKVKKAMEEGVKGAAIGAGIGAIVGGPLGAAAGGAIGASSGTGKKRVAAYNKGREVVQSVKDKAKKIKQTLKSAQEKRRESVKKSMAKEEKMTPMQDNNLFGNAYAGSQKQKKKAIDAIPHKGSEEYRRNLQHKSPTDPRESVELLGADGKVSHEIVDIIKPEPMKVPESPMKWKELVEKVKLPATNGSIINVYLTWRGRGISIKLFFPQSRTRRPTREEVNSQIQKVYPGAKVANFVESDPEPGEPFLQVGD